MILSNSLITNEKFIVGVAMSRGRGHIGGRDNTPPDIPERLEGLGIAVWCDKILYYTRV